MGESLDAVGFPVAAMLLATDCCSAASLSVRWQSTNHFTPSACRDGAQERPATQVQRSAGHSVDMEQSDMCPWDLTCVAWDLLSHPRMSADEAHDEHVSEGTTNPHLR